MGSLFLIPVFTGMTEWGVVCHSRLDRESSIFLLSRDLNYAFRIHQFI